MYNYFYKNQFSLLLKVLPCLKEIDDFVLKGGTAINLFYRDLPRISVDIDLTYTKILSRDETIKKMNDGLEKLAERITKRVPTAKIQKRYAQNNEYILKLNVIGENSIIKIEPNFVLRGTIHPPEYLTVSNRVTEEFGEYIDVKLLLETEGISDILRKTFIVYLACCVRPIHEILNPTHLDISSLYTNQFQDMPTAHISLDELINTRENLIKKLQNELTEVERNFLYSIKQGAPDYSWLPFENLDQLPALRWKILNINKMDKKKHNMMLEKLKKILFE